MLIHKATQNQIKEEYVNDKRINSLMKEMELKLEDIEKIFNKLGFTILDNPDGMFFAGFTWKLEMKGAEHTFIFDILFSNRAFAIYITREDLIPKGEEQHYFNNEIPCLKAKDFSDWITFEKLEDFLSDITTIFMRS